MSIIYVLMTLIKTQKSCMPMWMIKTDKERCIPVIVENIRGYTFV